MPWVSPTTLTLLPRARGGCRWVSLGYNWRHRRTPGPALGSAWQKSLCVSLWSVYAPQVPHVITGSFITITLLKRRRGGGHLASSPSAPRSHCLLTHPRLRQPSPPVLWAQGKERFSGPLVSLASTALPVLLLPASTPLGPAYSIGSFLRVLTPAPAWAALLNSAWRGRQ